MHTRYAALLVLCLLFAICTVSASGSLFAQSNHNNWYFYWMKSSSSSWRYPLFYRACCGKAASLTETYDWGVGIITSYYESCVTHTHTHTQWHTHTHAHTTILHSPRAQGVAMYIHNSRRASLACAGWLTFSTWNEWYDLEHIVLSAIYRPYITVIQKDLCRMARSYCSNWSVLMALVGSSFAEVPEVPSELQRTDVCACVCVCVCVCVHVCTHAMYLF